MKKFEAESVSQLTALAEQQVFTHLLYEENDAPELVSGGKGSLQMYVEMSALALNNIVKYDPAAANTLRGVIDYLVSDMRLKPGELDQQKELTQQALAEVETLQLQVRRLTQINLTQNTRLSQNKQRIDAQNQQLTQQEAEIQRLQRQVQEQENSLRGLGEKVQNQIYEQLDIKTQRDESVRRQNLLVQQSQEHRSLYERASQEKQYYQKQLEKYITSDKEQKKLIAELEQNLQTTTDKLKQVNTQMNTVQAALNQQELHHQEEKLDLTQKVSLLTKERMQMAAQLAQLQESTGKLQKQLNIKSKAVERMHQIEHKLRQLNQEKLLQSGTPRQPVSQTLESLALGQVANLSMDRFSTNSFSMPAQTEDFQCQVNTGYFLQTVPKKEIQRILLDEDSPMDVKLESIQLELSQTSDADTVHFSKHKRAEKDLPAPSDDYQTLRAKIHARFVPREQHEQALSMTGFMQQKYEKYKSKYQRVLQEITLQIINAEMTQVTAVSQQLNSLLESTKDGDSAQLNQLISLNEVFKARRDALEQEIKTLIQRFNITEMRVVEQSRRTSLRLNSDQYIISMCENAVQIIPELTSIVKFLQDKERGRDLLEIQPIRFEVCDALTQTNFVLIDQNMQTEMQKEQVITVHKLDVGTMTFDMRAFQRQQTQFQATGVQASTDQIDRLMQTEQKTIELKQTEIQTEQLQIQSKDTGMQTSVRVSQTGQQQQVMQSLQLAPSFERPVVNESYMQTDPICFEQPKPATTTVETQTDIKYESAVEVQTEIAVTTEIPPQAEKTDPAVVEKVVVVEKEVIKEVPINVIEKVPFEVVKYITVQPVQIQQQDASVDAVPPEVEKSSQKKLAIMAITEYCHLEADAPPQNIHSVFYTASRQPRPVEEEEQSRISTASEGAREHSEKSVESAEPPICSGSGNQSAEAAQEQQNEQKDIEIGIQTTKFAGKHIGLQCQIPGVSEAVQTVGLEQVEFAQTKRNRVGTYQSVYRDLIGSMAGESGIYGSNSTDIACQTEQIQVDLERLGLVSVSKSNEADQSKKNATKAEALDIKAVLGQAFISIGVQTEQQSVIPRVVNVQGDIQRLQLQQTMDRMQEKITRLEGDREQLQTESNLQQNIIKRLQRATGQNDPVSTAGCQTVITQGVMASLLLQFQQMQEQLKRRALNSIASHSTVDAMRVTSDPFQSTADTTMTAIDLRLQRRQIPKATERSDAVGSQTQENPPELAVTPQRVKSFDQQAPQKAPIVIQPLQNPIRLQVARKDTEFQGGQDPNEMPANALDMMMYSKDDLVVVQLEDTGPQIMPVRDAVGLFRERDGERKPVARPSHATLSDVDAEIDFDFIEERYRKLQRQRRAQAPAARPQKERPLKKALPDGQNTSLPKLQRAVPKNTQQENSIIEQKQGETPLDVIDFSPEQLRMEIKGLGIGPTEEPPSATAKKYPQLPLSEYVHLNPEFKPPKLVIDVVQKQKPQSDIPFTGPNPQLYTKPPEPQKTSWRTQNETQPVPVVMNIRLDVVPEAVSMDVAESIVPKIPKPPKAVEPLGTLYKLEGNHFVSPFEMAIKRRMMKKIAKQVKSQSRRRRRAEKTQIKQNGIEIQFRPTLKQTIETASYFVGLFEDQPRVFSSLEYEALSQLQLIKKVSLPPAEFYASDATLQDVQQHKAIVTFDTGTEVSYLALPIASRLLGFLKARQFTTINSQHQKHSVAVKLAPHTILRSRQWLRRSLRLFYYDCGQKPSDSFARMFDQWVLRRFPASGPATRFLSLLSAALLGNKEDPESRLFWCLFEADADLDFCLDFFALRSELGLEQTNPAVQPLEIMDADPPVPETQLRALCEARITSQKQVDAFVRYGVHHHLSVTQAVHLLCNVANQTRLKQLYRLYNAFSMLEKPYINALELKGLLEAEYPFLNNQALDQIVLSAPTDKIDALQYVMLNKAFTNPRQQSDDLMISAERQFQMCDQILQNLLSKELLTQQQADKLDVLRTDCQVQIQRCNAINASFRASQYYKALLKIKPDKELAKQ